jgi:hypothetical protein
MPESARFDELGIPVLQGGEDVKACKVEGTDVAALYELAESQGFEDLKQDQIEDFKSKYQDFRDSQDYDKDYGPRM